jgi:uncharacterized iron-regulated membrane protein
MTAHRLFFISLVALFLATCGLAGFFIIAFKYFTYQGSGLDWIYPTGGLLVLAWAGSAFTAVASGVTAIVGVIRHKYKQRHS